MKKQTEHSALYMDVGNSTVTWAVGERIVTGDGWQRLAFDRPVFVASVLDETTNRKLAGELQRYGAERVVWAYSESHWRGLKNGYVRPETLGVDRWLAMIAAWSWQQGAWLVIDAGTAITVDWIDETGQHLGGHIIPGTKLGMLSLRNNTAKAHAELSNIGFEQLPPFSDNTQDAISHGVHMAIAAYIKTQLDLFRQRFPSGHVVFGGGAGRSLSVLCPTAKVETALVIRGLQARFGERGQ